MSTRILFADDSMTAQNMGKKILTDAGYEVVAVSNGAAAVKKIAEQKPDIIILDIYMPGYTGLEVCDKVRSSIETLKTPVLLTVGKMEPYRAEDANRVRADGVIIKPFEASDLLAVIKKLEARVVPKTAPRADDTILLERPPEFAELPPLASENHTEMHGESVHNTVQATVDVPDNMATTAAFSDLLGMEPAYSHETLPLPNQAYAAELPVSSQPPVEPPAPMPELASLSSQEVAATTPFDVIPARARDVEAEEEYPAFSASSSFAANGAAEVSTEPVTSSLPDTQPIPVYRDPEPEPKNDAAAPMPQHLASMDAEEYEARRSLVTPGHTEEYEAPTLSHVVPVVAEEEAHLPVEPEKSAVFAAATMPPPETSSSSIDPAYDPFSAKVEAHIQQIERIVSASEARHLEAEVKAPVENDFERPALASVSSSKVVPSVEDDFEARVAAAMSIYEEPVLDKVEPEPVAAEEAQPIAHAAEITHEYAPEPESFETPYRFEYSPPVQTPEAELAFEPTPHDEVWAVEEIEPEAETSQHRVETPVSAQPVVQIVEDTAAAVEHQVESPEEVQAPWEQPIDVQPVQHHVDDETIMSEIEAQLPVASADADADPGSQTQMISAAVHRVLERLKPQLIEEISRELKSKK